MIVKLILGSAIVAWVWILYEMYAAPKKDEEPKNSDPKDLENQD